jgi:hypothetical protein
MKFFTWLISLFQSPQSPILPTETYPTKALRVSTKGVSRKRWSNEDIDELLFLWAKDYDVVYIASHLNRTQAAIRSKLHEYGYASSCHTSMTGKPEQSEPQVINTAFTIREIAVVPMTQEAFVQKYAQPREPHVINLSSGSINNHKPWSHSDDKQLMKMLRYGLTTIEIQSNLGRTKSAIASRISKLTKVSNQIR